ncbi:phosphonate metabolism protein/1,5-bisphosphokinase (PRPP-forming) PhnN [Labrenzia polysiphoniae]|uniref:Ribose 1,5-bisphosphate phosphokinase PhnN n=1 Tax=Roseibium polysiphoniae TaxID=2571221 RepID=A0ABR9CEW0_9HYPH|nr:phosphonate metabolism protein/1,5-bisphosphokinase (PRPP-forming) PhnN [Roseibium polysiphoniae]
MCRLSVASGAKAAALPEAPQQSNAEKVGPGRLVLVVGPSGAGKDTLLDGLRARLKERADVQFARRAITREADAGSEDHDTLSQKEFDHLVETGNVALAWSAHDLGYVIPVRYDDAIRAGRTVIANGSRRALPSAFAKYQNVAVLLITAPIEVLAERLASRGRESREAIEKRLKLADLEIGETEHVIRIENTGTVEDGVAEIFKQLEF